MDIWFNDGRASNDCCYYLNNNLSLDLNSILFASMENDENHSKGFEFSFSFFFFLILFSNHQPFGIGPPHDNDIKSKADNYL